MGRELQSLPTFIFGVALLAAGLATAIADLSPLTLTQTGSVAALATAVLVLVAVVLAPRSVSR